MALRLLSHMHDDKRLLREIKREVKRAGNRKRRRYLKDVTADADAFEFGRLRSDVMNLPPPASRPSAPNAKSSSLAVVNANDNASAAAVEEERR